MTISAVGLLVALVLVAAAQANSPRVTRGDAQALLEAFPTGGWSVLLHAGRVEGAPADFFPDSAARISPLPFWDGRHFCSLDWHVVNLALIEGNAEGESRTSSEIREALSQWENIFTLDGRLLETQRLVKRFLNPERFGLVEAWAALDGRVLSPEDLPVGEHSLQLTQVFAGESFTEPAITFFVDAPGTGACL